MSSSGSEDDGSPAEVSLQGNWWLQFLQVRLRFVILVGAVALLMAQWDRLQQTVGSLLSRVSGQQLASEIAADHEYFCPMDPGVLSAWPAICSICNMDLVPRRKGTAELLPEGVVARMQISPYRIQLAGLRTTPVSACDRVYQLQFSAAGVLWPEVSAAAVQLRIPVTHTDLAAFSDPVAVTLSGGGLSEPVAGLAVRDTDSDPDLPAIAVTLSRRPDLTVAQSALLVSVEFPIRQILTEQQRAVLGERPLLQVPASAVVDQAGTSIVYVQTMAGMFDGRVVQLGPRLDGLFPVLAGLESGEQVVSTGAFLVDAEARLNPALAVGYFGADQPAQTSTSAVAPLKAAAVATVLTDAERAAAAAQQDCPVTGLSLESMGGPVPVQVGERQVFICCRACERKLLKEPVKYLAKLRPATAMPATP